MPYGNLILKREIKFRAEKFASLQRNIIAFAKAVKALSAKDWTAWHIPAGRAQGALPPRLRTQ